MGRVPTIVAPSRWQDYLGETQVSLEPMARKTGLEVNVQLVKKKWTRRGQEEVVSGKGTIAFKVLFIPERAGKVATDESASVVTKQFTVEELQARVEPGARLSQRPSGELRSERIRRSDGMASPPKEGAVLMKNEHGLLQSQRPSGATPRATPPVLAQRASSGAPTALAQPAPGVAPAACPASFTTGRFDHGRRHEAHAAASTRGGPLGAAGRVLHRIPSFQRNSSASSVPRPVPLTPSDAAPLPVRVQSLGGGSSGSGRRPLQCGASSASARGGGGVNQLLSEDERRLRLEATMTRVLGSGGALRLQSEQVRRAMSHIDRGELDEAQQVLDEISGSQQSNTEHWPELPSAQPRQPPRYVAREAEWL